MPTYLSVPGNASSGPATHQTSSDDHRASLLDGSKPPNQDDDTQAAESSSPAQIRTLPILQGLIYEIVSLVVAAASFFGLLALLSACDQKPEQRWSFGPWAQTITLNTVVSIVSTVFRSCVLFPVATCISQFGWIWMTSPRGRSLQDLSSYHSASSGPLGSLLLLWRLRFWHFASIGAAITFVAFAIGPFFQQSVTYELRSVIDPDFSLDANAAAAYTWGEGLSGWSYPHTAHYNLPYNMTSAIVGGMFAPDSSSIIQAPSECPTGNCTWESFGTLSVNSRCVDLWSGQRLFLGEDGTWQDLESLKDPAIAKMLDPSNEYVLFSINATMPSMMDPTTLQPFLNLTTAMVIVHWVRLRSDKPSFDFNGPKTKVDSFQCAIYFSAKEILPQVKNGAYTETVLQEVTLPENVQFMANKTYGRRYFVNVHDGWDPLEFRLPGLPPSRRNNFTVEYSTYLPIYSQLMNDLQGGVSFGNRQISDATAPLMLYKADSIPRALQNMADSITNEMRRNATTYNPESKIRGNVWVQRQFVVVRWVWLVLPAVTLAFGSLFLVGAVVETRRNDVGLWLSSQLALLFHAHLEADGKDVIASADPKALNTADGMLEVAKHLNTRIMKGSGTIEIVASTPTKAQEEDVELRSLSETVSIQNSRDR